MISSFKTFLSVAGVSTIALLATMPFAPSALAQQTQQGNIYNFNIPSKPLLSALSSFTNLTGIQVIHENGGAIQGNSVAVNGRQSADEALATMLSGSNIQYRFINARTISLYNSPASESASNISSDENSLSPVIIRGGSRAADMFIAPKSTVYVTGDDLDRFGSVSVADSLKGIPGVQVGDSRNGGALDVNIRGIQGQSRIAITIDGSQQALNVYRGYAGTQQRSYIDQDLISDMIITKGPGFNPATASAIGGTIEINTLKADDIILPGNNIGFRLKGELWNNGVSIPNRSDNIFSSSQLSQTPETSRNGIINSAAKSGSVAFAYANDNFSIVTAYAKREQGNYFAGKYGRDRYRMFSESGTEQASVATNYEEGNEILNTSVSTESFLLKTGFNISDNQTLELSYRRFDGSFGEIMPSDIFRFGTGNIYQYPEGTMLINSATARYNFNPDSDLINLKANLWWTGSKSSQLNGVNGPASQKFMTDRNWVRMENKRIGVDISNESKFNTQIGEFDLTLAGAYQHEDIRPQKGVVITQNDIFQNRILRNGVREETNISAKLDYKPVEQLSIWGAGRFSFYRSRDKNGYSKAITEDLYGSWVEVNNASTYGYMYWVADENGNFTDANDPRLNNGIVFKDTNNPFDGIRYNDYGATSTYVYGPSITPTVTGFEISKPLHLKDNAFSPSVGFNYEIVPDTFVYANYTQGVRLPSLFETTYGTNQLSPTDQLKPERSKSFEIGASKTINSFITTGDTASAKITYFNNNVKDFITRFYDPQSNGMMYFRNADNYKTSGIEFQSHYDSGRFFGDLSATYYLNTETCDADFAAYLRKTANIWQETENTPNCTKGGFMGAYTNAQNPPKYAINLLTGMRFFDEKWVIGSRVSYTSGPTAEITEPWQTSATTPQIIYQPVTVVDIFTSFKLNKHASFNASVQNLTDRYYLDPLAQSFMPAPGRTFRLGLNAKF
ncbi:TonB-dependent receptor [Bartonella sp. HY329]|uniref:TonB-dependent receptor n=1 Tax=unclassified Bartonella TaxID=2645622 RepID=UPI0021C8B6C0|nr:MULTISPECIES: TonB-dependent receptor [unclassified Bartonella]UXM95260.1 TonB-dependent receptor [Bartonella sp. HY329]UXN09584.1 TonB-dependent receptor [Bartonella sp. HY328]